VREGGGGSSSLSLATEMEANVLNMYLGQRRCHQWLIETAACPSGGTMSWWRAMSELFRVIAGGAVGPRRRRNLQGILTDFGKPSRPVPAYSSPLVE
jgi:hypothetical protein